MSTESGPAALPRTHHPRAITYHGIRRVPGWRIKTYGVSAHTPAPRPAFLAAAARVATTTLASPPHPDTRHGIGFVVAHDAADYCFVLVDWWSGGNEIHQRMFSAPLDHPERLRPHPGHAIGCVWELAVVDFERRAWLRHVLARPGGPDTDAYLRAHFEDRV
jgi:hypothetical protein